MASNGAPQGTLNFLSGTPNLFNVAITRARACLIVVGNKGYCQNSNIHYLAHFASYIENLNNVAGITNQTTLQFNRIYPDVETTDVVSEWEKKLYTALYDRGIRTYPQYAIDKYHIDLALIENDTKLAIEVGEDVEYNWEQSYAIHLKNSRLIELGWNIVRFMPYQLDDDLEWCINQIQLKRKLLSN